MKTILSLLQQLDEVYHAGSLAEYEQTLQTAEQQVQQTFPGFTIAYAEITTVGAERYAHGGMRHVFLPEKTR